MLEEGRRGRKFFLFRVCLPPPHKVCVAKPKYNFVHTFMGLLEFKDRRFRVKQWRSRASECAESKL